MIARVIGYILLAAALAAVAAELVQWYQAENYNMLTLGELWFSLHPGSLNGAQAGIQRYVAPWLWDPVIVSILTLPAWAVFGVPAIACLVLARPSRRKKFRSRASRDS